MMILLLALLGGCEKNELTPSATSEAQPSSSAIAFRTAVELQDQGKFSESLKAAQKLLVADPQNPGALELIIELHQQMGKLSEAAATAELLAEVNRARSADILILAFQWYLQSSEFDSAERCLQRAVEVNPNHPQVRRNLAQLLNAQGRRQEASEHVRSLIRLRDINRNEILSLIDLSGPFLLASFDPYFDDSEPSLFLLGRARFQLAKKGEIEDLLSVVQQVVTRYPDHPAAAAFFGRLLIESGRQEAFEKWLPTAPAGIKGQAEYWSSIGSWLELNDEHRQAIRAFGEALLRDPTDRQSLRRMIASLEAVDEQPAASKLRERLEALEQIYRYAKEADSERCRWIASQMQDLVRPWESTAWLLRAAQLDNNVNQIGPQLSDRCDTILAWEQASTPGKVRELRLKQMLGFSLDRWPEPVLDRKRTGSAGRLPQPLQIPLQFTDIALDQGLNSPPHSGIQPEDDNVGFLHQSMGFGLAAWDYDLDGRVDAYVAHAGGTPMASDSAANQLFRQLPNRMMEEFASDAGLDHRGYSQGVAVGDLNQDGFPDLLIASIGANVVLINQGDGTFQQADIVNFGKDRWTSSMAVADLDGDHLPEIVEINYIDDSSVYRTACDDVMSCTPQQFNPTSDGFFRCGKDGRYDAWPEMASVKEKKQYGLGIMIANFDRQAGNDLFIANDGDYNHFWSSSQRPKTSEKQEKARPFVLVESAGIRGCSIGRNGRCQACMGVAAGDFNQDGTLDLHVTNFFQESDSLYLQNRSGTFSDETLKYQLYGSSIGRLGFGTQAADFNNDGWLDLAILNGHVYGEKNDPTPFRMQAQALRGSPQGFVEESQESLGPYFDRSTLGRTLATLDWNQDGRMDLLANHLDQPVALLQNETETQNWLQIELIGTVSERDATGAEVVVRCGDRVWHAWQTAGDGYMCTNESLIHVGLAEFQQIDQIEVSWPSAQKSTFTDLPVNGRYLIVEGQTEWTQR